MTREKDLELVLKIIHRWPPPELPLWIDMRPIDYLLSVTPTERLRRLELHNAIEKYSKLADIDTLQRVLDILYENAKANPFWNNGVAEQFWVGDQDEEDNA